jgi:predicted RNase H-like HicB family nuclease
MKNISVSFRIPFSIKKKGKWYVARCPVLDVTTQGDSEDAARANLADALYLFLVSCLERGTLDAVLKQCGFFLKTRKGRPPKNGNYIEIPIPFAAGNPRTVCPV